MRRQTPASGASGCTGIAPAIYKVTTEGSDGDFRSRWCTGRGRAWCCGRVPVATHVKHCKSTVGEDNASAHDRGRHTVHKARIQRRVQAYALARRHGEKWAGLDWKGRALRNLSGQWDGRHASDGRHCNASAEGGRRCARIKDLRQRPCDEVLRQRVTFPLKTP